MSGTEWLLVALVILVPAAIAILVSLWTLEQARLRSRKNRKPAAAKRQEAQPVATEHTESPRG